MNLFVSGLHSGPNPSPGVGTARSLRLAFPEARIVGIDYSVRSSGLHWADLDDIWVLPSWTHVNTDVYLSQIAEAVGHDGVWISGLDLEARWLAQAIERLDDEMRTRILVPSPLALHAVEKPAAAIAARLGLRVPPTIPATDTDAAVNAFGRQHGWRLWLKGPYYEAVRVGSWPQLLSARESLSATWGDVGLHLQAHIIGHEESVVLAAHRGRLHGARFMRKRAITEQGKTWAGVIEELPPPLLDAVKSVVNETTWHGGAEIEMLRDSNDELWLMEWNPRFPAWVHGATLAGYNFPAELVAAAYDVSPPRSVSHGDGFTRVVLEVPVKSPYSLPVLPDLPTDWNIPTEATKHPSGMPLLSRRKLITAGISSVPFATVPVPAGGVTAGNGLPDWCIRDLESAVERIDSTPIGVTLATSLTRRFEVLRGHLDEASGEGVDVLAAYSIKTNPHQELLSAALSAGLLAEAISQDEVKLAIETGFRPGDIVLNGPAKWWPQRRVDDSVRAAFCDSLHEFQQVVNWIDRGERVAATVGLRLRSPGHPSRFGVELAPWGAFEEAVDALGRLPNGHSFGVHFHVPQSAIGADSWMRLYRSMVQWASSLEMASGVEVRTLDVGGGWDPDDWDTVFLPQLPALVKWASQELPTLREFMLEPGKALAQGTMATVTRVLEVRSNGDLVVDGSIADLPEAYAYPHPVLLRGQDATPWQPLGRGSGRILGRT